MLTLALLPEVWFAGQAQWLLLLIAVVGMVGVIKGADWLVEGAAGIAARLGMPKVVIGATIVSLGTTSPEAAVSVLAAWQGDAGLALGNGVGSIIADTGLIFGIGCLLTRLPADRFVLNRQGWVQFGSALLLAGLCFGLFFLHGDDARLVRPMGALLIGLLVLYLAMSVKWSWQHPHGEPHLLDRQQDVDVDLVERKQRDPAQKPLVLLLFMGLLGLSIVIVSGDALVASVSELAEVHWGVPQAVIAATLVAFGTSLPELVVGLTAVRKGHAELLVGNVIGADILNVLFVIGAAALAKPLPITEPGTNQPYIFLWLHLPTMLLMLGLFRLYIFRAVRAGRFSRWMGLPLVGMYLVYTVIGYLASL
ncbi:MAG: calcium/sodium antiporter [Phycisphaeraceae bacterium]